MLKATLFLLVSAFIVINTASADGSRKGEIRSDASSLSALFDPSKLLEGYDHTAEDIEEDKEDRFITTRDGELRDSGKVNLEANEWTDEDTIGNRRVLSRVKRCGGGGGDDDDDGDANRSRRARRTRRTRSRRTQKSRRVRAREARKAKKARKAKSKKTTTTTTITRKIIQPTGNEGTLAQEQANTQTVTTTTTTASGSEEHA